MDRLILNRLVLVGQRPVAEARELDESIISRWKGKRCHIEQFCRFLNTLGIALSPPEAVLVRRDYLFAMDTLAEMGMNAERARPEPLGWDECRNQKG